jgi:hypothetical protein
LEDEAGEEPEKFFEREEEKSQSDSSIQVCPRTLKRHKSGKFIVNQMKGGI